MPYDEGANEQLLQAHAKGLATCEVIVDGKVYRVDFVRKVQNRIGAPGRERRIRYDPAVPQHWIMTEEEALAGGRKKFTKQVHDKEMLDVLEALLNDSVHRHDGSACSCPHGGSKYVVKEAFQVRNPHLWLEYKNRREVILGNHKQLKLSPEEITPPIGTALTKFGKRLDVDFVHNERLLLHGTRSMEQAQEIATHGFDHRVANNGLYGKGTYFAAQTCKSAQYATNRGHQEKASDEMLGTMLVSRVLIGHPYYTAGSYYESRASSLLAVLVGPFDFCQLQPLSIRPSL